MYLFLKIASSAVIIGFVTEVARRFPVYGGIVAALPLISILSIIWLTLQGTSNHYVSQFAWGVLVGLPATAVMLLVIYFGLKYSIHLALAILLGTIAWGLFLLLQNLIMKAFAS
ncbi:DUF3147 family protein [Heyndrickxia oleronia]|uniref:DUF3147 family protein n=1 Tax=Heyndrickxia oleronia TaxID=38875 RepID=A0AAW6SZ52_9BACI|nr:DUF3147 family protein [Heyndrickxia oleronia]MDH5162297.1 DUF3147 family protein [Heyndrickxia oleronia]